MSEQVFEYKLVNLKTNQTIKIVNYTHSQARQINQAIQKDGTALIPV